MTYWQILIVRSGRGERGRLVTIATRGRAPTCRRPTRYPQCERTSRSQAVVSGEMTRQAGARSGRTPDVESVGMTTDQPPPIADQLPLVGSRPRRPRGRLRALLALT